MRALLVVALAALMLILPHAAAHGGPVTITYVGGTATQVDGIGPVGGACAKTPVHLHHAGGACAIPIHGGHPMRIDLVDDVHGPSAFWWVAHDALANVCAQGSGSASGIFAIPASCATLSVHAPLGATKGTITLAPA